MLFAICLLATIASLIFALYFMHHELTREMLTLAPIATVLVGLGGITFVATPGIFAYAVSLRVELANGILTVRQLGRRTARSPVTNLRQVVLLSSRRTQAVAVEFPDGRQLVLSDPPKAVAALRDRLVAEYGPDRVSKR